MLQEHQWVRKSEEIAKSKPLRYDSCFPNEDLMKLDEPFVVEESDASNNVSYSALEKENKSLNSTAS